MFDTYTLYVCNNEARVSGSNSPHIPSFQAGDRVDLLEAMGKWIVKNADVRHPPYTMCLLQLSSPHVNIRLESLHIPCSLPRYVYQILFLASP